MRSLFAVLALLALLSCDRSPESTSTAKREVVVSRGGDIAQLIDRGDPDSVQAQDSWAAADSAVLRLSPGRFSELPPEIVSALQARGCTIPQTPDEAEPHNVIRGHFARAAQLDWAVLCSRDHTSSVLVFWGGSPDEPDEFGAVPDQHFLQSLGSQGIGFSRRIGVADREYIRSNYDAFGGPELPPLDHDGIEDAFVGKASQIAYFHQGEWLSLTGAD